MTLQTETMIRKAARDNLHIICKDHNEAVLLSEQAESLGLTIQYPITFTEFINWDNFFGRRVNGFIMADNQEFLEFIAAGKPISVMGQD